MTICWTPPTPHRLEAVSGGATHSHDHLLSVPLVDVSISGGYILMWSPIGWVDGWAFKEHFEGP